MRSGDVFHYHSRITRPPKDKFVICVCPEERLFFFINSHPPIAEGAGVEISPADLPCLSRVSYVDTSMMIMVYPDELDERSARGGISPPLRRRIAACARSHGILPERFLGILERNFHT
ncbi:MAG: hypothetical protein OXL41_12125 [Nitrospinae bacterium]|nr:hypothetical protein [Nitrospinota bacterium]